MMRQFFVWIVVVFVAMGFVGCFGKAKVTQPGDEELLVGVHIIGGTGPSGVWGFQIFTNQPVEEPLLIPLQLRFQPDDEWYWHEQTEFVFIETGDRCLEVQLKDYLEPVVAVKILPANFVGESGLEEVYTLSRMRVKVREQYLGDYQVDNEMYKSTTGMVSGDWVRLRYY